MKINQSVLDQFVGSPSKLLVVSKYFDPLQTAEITQALKNNPAVIGFGENRPQSLLDKKIDQKLCHFIGNIQSRQIPVIAEHCSVVHSLCSLKHARIFFDQPRVPVCFIQVNVSGENQKGGLLIEEVEDFLRQLPDNFPIQGISAIGAYTDDLFIKNQEFLSLLDLRKTLRLKKSAWAHLKVLGWQLSAGTSIDYQIALDHGIDIVRVGRGLFQS
jgi:uncharacterized pyridoxal phosphate-containing UPF0001 family protein